ncbi:hypothetical protein EBT25_17385 [bacterium]|jgi:hypothetical protein|nr:hypothetical protein [bacterium]
MVGFETKRDMAMARYADMETIDHIIELRKELTQVKKERDNVLAHAVEMAVIRAENDWLKDKVIKLNGVVTKLSNELKIMRDNEE